MSTDNFTDGFCKTRPVLGDLTNRPVKRGIPTILGDKPGDVYCKNLDVQDGDSQFPKKVCLGVENLVREKCKSKFGVDSNEKGSNFSKDKQACGSSATSSGDDDTSEDNIESFISKVPKEFKEKSNLSDRGVHSFMEVGDASRDSLSSGSIPTCSGLWKKDYYGAGENCLDDEERNDSDVTQSNLFNEGLATLVWKNSENSLGVGKLAATNCGSIEWSKLPKSQGSKFPELGKCTALKGEGFRDMNIGEDLLKTCSCSFCLKGNCHS